MSTSRAAGQAPIVSPAATTALLVGAAAVTGALAACAFAFEIGQLAARMGLHLALMNVAAPLLALRLAPVRPERGLLWIAATAQMALLWTWHAPAAAGAGGFLLQTAFLVALGAGSVAFWIAVAQAGAARRWGAVGTLLVTGKLACLLGALMLFAPRDLYGLPALVFAWCDVGASSLADQQLAGMMMLAACPLSYVLAALVLTVDAVGATGEAEAPRGPQRRA